METSLLVIVLVTFALMVTFHVLSVPSQQAGVDYKCSVAELICIMANKKESFLHAS